MEQYKYRGLPQLIVWLAVVVPSVLLCYFWKGSWGGTIGSILGFSLVELPEYVKLRRMTPEQFAAYQKKKLWFP